MNSHPVVNFLRGNWSLGLLIVALLALRWTIVEPYVVPSPSMEPTLKIGDRLYALKCAYDIKIPFTDIPLLKTGSVKRGDVILFRAPHAPDLTYVKRAVGLPGDKLEFRNGVLFVNDQEIAKSTYPDRTDLYDIEYADKKDLYLEDLSGVKHHVILFSEGVLPESVKHELKRTVAPFYVPENHLFAVGDNRDNSSDSRMWGFVPMTNLKGKAMFRWYSSLDFKPRPERIGTLIQ